MSANINVFSLRRQYNSLKTAEETILPVLPFDKNTQVPCILADPLSRQLLCNGNKHRHCLAREYFKAMPTTYCYKFRFIYELSYPLFPS
jgi:hypothetical protein